MSERDNEQKFIESLRAILFYAVMIIVIVCVAVIVTGCTTVEEKPCKTKKIHSYHTMYA